MHAHIHHVSYTLRIAAHAPPRARAHLVMLIDDAVEGAVNVAVGQADPCNQGLHVSRHTSHVATTFCRELQSGIFLAAPRAALAPAPAPTHVVAAALKRRKQVAPNQVMRRRIYRDFALI